MKLILHLARKDLWHVRWYVGFWVLIAAAKFALGLMILFTQALDPAPTASAAAVLGSAGWAITAFIGAVIVQQDVITGSKAFWQTRPVSSARLLAAKAVALTVTGLAIPILVHLPWWAGFGFRPHDLWFAVVELVGWQLLILLPAVMLAALTDTFSRFLVWSLVFALAVLTGPGLWVDLTVPAKTVEALKVSQTLVQVAVLGVMALAVTAVMYLTRRIVIAIGLVVAGVAASATVGARWPINFFDEEFDSVARPPELAPEIGRDVQLTFRGARNVGTRPVWDYGVRRVMDWIQLSFDVSGKPDGLVFRYGGGVQALVWPNGLSIRVGGGLGFTYSGEPFRSALAVPTPVEDPETKRWRDAQEAERIRKLTAIGVRRPSAWVESRAAAAFFLRQELTQLAMAQKPRWVADTDVRLAKPVKDDDLPAWEGVSTRAGGAYFRLKFVLRDTETGTKRADRTPDGVWRHRILVGYRYAQPRFWWDTWRNRSQEEETWRGIVNAKTGEKLGGIRFQRRPFVVASVSLENDNMEFQEPMLRRGDKWVYSDPEILEHLRLMVVHWEDVSRFRRQIMIDHLEIQPAEPSS